MPIILLEICAAHESLRGSPRHSAAWRNLVAIGGIADIERFSAGNDLQLMTHFGSGLCVAAGHHQTREAFLNSAEALCSAALS